MKERNNTIGARKAYLVRRRGRSTIEISFCTQKKANNITRGEGAGKSRQPEGKRGYFRIWEDGNGQLKILWTTPAISNFVRHGLETRLGAGRSKRGLRYSKCP